MSQEIVLVTGATGFIAQHILDSLLSRKYTVIGTARPQERYGEVIDNFKQKYPNSDLSFEIVPDIATPGAFDELLKNHTEIKYILHTASPFSFGLNKPLDEAYLQPAVNGTLNMLNAIKKYAPQVTNVVITSSFAAIRQPGPLYPTALHTNQSWNPITWKDVKNENDAYYASKTEMEHAARKFYQEEKPSYSLATVNPPFVIGPQTFDSFVTKELNTSNETINKITHLPQSNEPQNQFPLLAIDVRDVAEFHVLPLENKELANQREFIVSSPFIAQKVLNILNDNIPELKGKIAKGDYNSVVELEQKYCPKYDISDTTSKVPGYKFIPLEKSVVDAYQQYFSKYPLS